MALKVKRPHDKYLRGLVDVDSTTVSNPGSGLYLSRLAKASPEDFGIRPIKRDMWLIFRKKPLKVGKEGGKYTWFI